MSDTRRTAANDDAGDAPGTGSATGAAKCPLCRKPADGKFRPFCSARCRDVDLHRWLGGAYVIPVAPDPDDWDGGDGTVPPETGAVDVRSVDEE